MQTFTHELDHCLLVLLSSLRLSNWTIWFPTGDEKREKMEQVRRCAAQSAGSHGTNLFMWKTQLIFGIEPHHTTTFIQFCTEKPIGYIHRVQWQPWREIISFYEPMQPMAIPNTHSTNKGSPAIAGNKLWAEMITLWASGQHEIQQQAIMSAKQRITVCST